MKINELINFFEIQTSNEEKEVLSKMSSARPLSSYSERDRFIIEGLIRKALVSKVIQDNTILVVANGSE